MYVILVNIINTYYLNPVLLTVVNCVQLVPSIIVTMDTPRARRPHFGVSQSAVGQEALKPAANGATYSVYKLLAYLLFTVTVEKHIYPSTIL